MSTETVELAEKIARNAHAGQVDKVGRPYIEHVARVTAGVHGADEQAAAWLHDVLEDTQVMAEELRAWGVPARVVAAVRVLTHHPHEPRVDYYARVRADPIALAVKLADVADNSDPERLAMLDDVTRERLTEKYRKAREQLA